MATLSSQVIESNDRHKDALDAYTNKLQIELLTIDRLIAAVEKLPEDEGQEDPNDKWCLHVENAFKPSCIIDLTTTRDENSPFYEDAIRRDRYIKATVPNPFSNPEKRYLEKAIVKENKRLVALRAKQCGKDAFEAVAGDNDFFLNNIEGIDWTSVARDVSAANYPLGSRTAQECKVRWLGSQHPKINNSQWSNHEEERLRELVVSKGAAQIDWEEISQLLGTNRTPLDCIRRYRASSRPTIRWTSALDQKLMGAVQKHGNSNWSLVASAVSPEVSANQCQVRYGRSLNPAIKRGKFSAAEDELLKQAVEAHGSEWVKVAQALPGRTNVQCRERYKHQLMGGTVKTPWTEEEDKMLKDAVKKYGENWEMVREAMNYTREQKQYASRYRIITRKNLQGAAVRTAQDNTSTSISRDEANIELNASMTKHGKAADLQGNNDAVRLTIRIPTLVGKAKRSRKYLNLQRDGEDFLPESDNSNDSIPKKRPRPRPRPRHNGAVVTTRDTSSIHAPDPTQYVNEGHGTSQPDRTSKDTTYAATGDKGTPQKQLPETAASTSSADLSDLTDLEDLEAALNLKRKLRSDVQTTKTTPTPKLQLKTASSGMPSPLTKRTRRSGRNLATSRQE